MLSLQAIGDPLFLLPLSVLCFWFWLHMLWLVPGSSNLFHCFSPCFSALPLSCFCAPSCFHCCAQCFQGTVMFFGMFLLVLLVS